METTQKPKYPNLERLIEILEILRGENGCAWDREQTHYSLKKNMIEEAYEAVDAIEDNDLKHLEEELGDVLLQVVLHSQIAKEEKAFDIDDVAKGISDKLVHRHPHVFGNIKVNGTQDILANWDKLKAEEKKHRKSAMDGISKAQSALMSAQKIKPDHATIMMYDGGLTYHKGGFIAEVEYLYKHYSHNAFKDVHAFDSFVSYDIPIRRSLITKISPLVRYDFMTDHSDGMRYLDGEENEEGELIINDYKRNRITGGVTISLAKPFVSDIRINYEKYFYHEDALAKTSEKDKFVIEFVTRF